MAEQVTLPGGLKVDKKVAIGIVVLSVAVGGFYYYKKKQTAAASSTATDTSSANIDPQTGFAYGSPEDNAALAQMSGGTLGQVNSGSFVGGQVIGYDQYGNPIYGQGQGGSGTPGAFATNTQWSQFAEAAMGSTGADAIAAALGKYLLGQPLTVDQVTVIQQAIAAAGFPPIGGPGGNPPGYLTTGGSSGGGGGGGGGTGVNAKNPVTGIHVTPRTTQVDVSWTALPNAKQYLVKAWIGSKVQDQTTVTGTSATLHNLRPNTSYKISVWGQPGSGSTGSVTTHTK